MNYLYPDLVTYLSRSDWQGTYPVQPVAGLTLNDEMIRILDGKIYEKPDDAPDVDSITQGDQQGIMLITMKGLDYNDDLWETFISQMTIEEMAALIANNFGTEAVDSVGKPATPALRGLEGGVVNGKAHSLMQAFNRLGFTGCSLSKALNTNVVRGEWGYVGHIETDAIGAVTTGYKTAFEAMMAAGTDSFCLDTQHQSSAAIVQAIRSNNDGFMLQQLRRAAKDILYNDANSSMMNGIGNNTRIVKIIPWWQPALRSVTIGVSVLTGLAVLAMLAAKLAYYKKQKGAEKK